MTTPAEEWTDEEKSKFLNDIFHPGEAKLASENERLHAQCAAMREMVEWNYTHGSSWSDQKDHDEETGYHRSYSLAEMRWMHEWYAKNWVSNDAGATMLAELTALRKVAAAAKQTITDNGHLADGDCCTLKTLRDALSEWEQCRAEKREVNCEPFL